VRQRRNPTITGIGVSPGRVVGPVVLMPQPIAEPPSGRRLAPGEDPEVAADRISAAAARVRDDLAGAALRTSGKSRELLEATSLMAADPTLVADARQRVYDDNLVPERAIWEAAGRVCEDLAAVGGVVAERVRDVRDVRDRLVAAVTGQSPPGVPEPREPSVLVATDLAPADAATLDPERFLAVVTESGGPISHTAIIARELGIPAVAAAVGAMSAVVEGAVVLVDGGRGTMLCHPGPRAIASVVAATPPLRIFDGRGRTADGVHVELLANVVDPHSAVLAAHANAEGVGLFRTEFCFLGRDEAPSVAEQIEAYRSVFAAFPERKVVIRTLDASADKPLPFLGLPVATNPALAPRGWRATAHLPALVDDQLRAIAEAARQERADVWVMAPMVATPQEAAEFVERCRQHGLLTAGVMIEVPSAALRARQVFVHAAFASIGTNDLAQYAMAADRLDGSLADLCDPWQPAVLELIAATCAGATIASRPVGVCGEAAAMPALAPVLVGLGVTSLSMTPRALADVAAVLATTSSADCARLAELALDAPDARSARERVRSAIPALAGLHL